MIIFRGLNQCLTQSNLIFYQKNKIHDMCLTLIFPKYSMATPSAYLCFHALNSGTKRKFSSKKFVSQFWTFFGFIWYVIYISVTFSYFYVGWWFEASNIKTFCLRKFDFLQHWLQSSKYHVIKEVKEIYQLVQFHTWMIIVWLNYFSQIKTNCLHSVHDSQIK